MMDDRQAIAYAYGHFKAEGKDNKFVTGLIGGFRTHGQITAAQRRVLDKIIAQIKEKENEQVLTIDIPIQQTEQSQQPKSISADEQLRAIVRDELRQILLRGIGDAS